MDLYQAISKMLQMIDLLHKTIVQILTITSAELHKHNPIALKA